MTGGINYASRTCLVIPSVTSGGKIDFLIMIARGGKTIFALVVPCAFNMPLTIIWYVSRFTVTPG